MDMATVFGMLLAWGALIGSLLMEGGDIRSLINLPAALLVFGGTLGAATISFKMSEIMQLPQILSQAFLQKTLDLSEVITVMVGLADKARHKGMLSLEEERQRIDDAFLQRGLRLAIDGAPPELVRSILGTETHLIQAQHRIGENIFTTLGGFAPTLGIIGTVMGLIHMLANLTDPGKMGPVIAGAFLATLYGVSSANLLFLPIANKLRARGQEEILIREVMVEGLLAIQAGDNPRIVEEKLRAFLQPETSAQTPELAAVAVTPSVR